MGQSTYDYYRHTALTSIASDIEKPLKQVIEELCEVKRRLDVLDVNVPSHGGVKRVSREIYNKLREHPSILWAYKRSDFDLIGTMVTLYVMEDDGTVMPFLDEVLK